MTKDISANVLYLPVEMERKKMVSELLKLLLLLLVFVINLPSCWSLCDISAARKQAHVGTCKKLGSCKLAEDVAKRAADQAGVVFEKVVEAYKVCSLGTTDESTSC